jgi:hypothetical protein
LSNNEEVICRALITLITKLPEELIDELDPDPNERKEMEEIMEIL